MLAGIGGGAAVKRHPSLSISDEDAREKHILERIARIHKFRSRRPSAFFGRHNYQGAAGDDEFKQYIPGMNTDPFGAKRRARPVVPSSPQTSGPEGSKTPSKHLVFKLHNYVMDSRFQCTRLDFGNPRSRTDVAPLVSRKVHEEEVLTKRLIVPVERLKSLCYERADNRGRKRVPAPDTMNIDLMVGRRRHPGMLLDSKGCGPDRRSKEDLCDSFNICGFVR